jgi:basic amino acid/polyamine antiporter, APA family
MTADAHKPLGFLALLALGINGTIGVGIFFAPTEVAASVPGGLGALVYLGTGLLMLPVAVVYGRLGARFAEDGGPYVWAKLSFGPGFAFLVGWLTYASALLSAATVASGLSEHLGGTLAQVAPGLGQKGWAVAIVLALSSATAAGLRLSAITWSGLTVLKLLPLIGLALLGAYAAVSGHEPVASVPSTTREVDFGRAVLIVVFALQGFEVVPVLAGSTHSQARVPWAVVGTLVACTAFYGVLHAICVHALPNLAHQKAPLVAAAAALGGTTAGAIVSLGQTVSALGIAYGQYAVTPRYLSALGHTDALGSFLGVEDARRVPQRALWLTTAAVLGLLLSDALSSIAVLAQYAVATLALAWLAYRGVHGVPRREALWALPALVGIGLTALGAEAKELLATAMVSVVGVALLLLTRKLRAR